MSGADDMTQDLPGSGRAPDSTHAETIAEAPVVPTVGHEGAAPQSIGEYAIDEVLGEGGMGTVYCARQKNPDREVALKVIRPGYASGKMLKRFELEAQLLGRLQHPGIAQIYEAGTFATPRGPSPYFAMELVRGEPLDAYCERHGLGTRQRLEIFARVADAVEHAHVNGIIHRDLKPGNILVTPSGQPKILDFGVARATDSDIQATTINTDIGQLIGTVPYMSPEQITGDPTAIDVRSDVYALGVVLYELLAGQLPYDLRQRMIHEAARIIREDDPAPLSMINRTLRGDVETIVEKALEKDPARRYQTATAMAEDLRRYLGNKPIVARPPSTIYQLQKFARRNTAVVVGVAAVFVVLVLGIIVSTGQAVRATRAEQNARNSLAEAQETVNFLDNMLAAVDPGAMGKDVTVRAVLDQSSSNIDKDFADRPMVAARLHTTIGRTYSSLGVYDAAEPHLRAALDLRTRELGPKNADTIQAQVNLGELQIGLGAYEAAEQTLLAALHDAETQFGEHSPTTLSAVSRLGMLYAEVSDFEKAEPALRRALALSGELYGEDHVDTIGNANNLAMLLADQERFDEAESIYDDIIQRCESVLGPGHPMMLQVQSNLAWLYFWAKRYQESVDLGEQVLAGKIRVLGEDHPETTSAMNNLAVAYRAIEMPEKAEPLYRKDLEISERILGPEHPEIAITLTNFGRFLTENERAEDALGYLERAITISRKVYPKDFYGTGFTLGFYAQALRALERFEEAEQNFLEAKGIFDVAFPPEHPIHANIALDMVKLYEAWDKPDKAAQWQAMLPPEESESEVQ